MRRIIFFKKTPTDTFDDTIIIKIAFISQVHLLGIKKNSTYFFKFVLIMPYNIENEKVVDVRI